MTRERLLMVLGALVLLSPWSGIPMEWLQWILLLIGLAIIGIAIMIRRQAAHSGMSLPPVPPAPPTAFPSQPESPSRPSNIAFS